MYSEIIALTIYNMLTSLLHRTSAHRTQPQPTTPHLACVDVSALSINFFPYEVSTSTHIGFRNENLSHGYFSDYIISH